jgi:aminoglycoside 6'-N-acetyltransferase
LFQILPDPRSLYSSDAGGETIEDMTVLVFRPLERDDFALLSGWFAKPHVERWWREEHDLQSIEERYGPIVDLADPTEAFVVMHDRRAVGMAQRYLVRDDPNWSRSISEAGCGENAAGIDYLIGEEPLVGTGLGPKMIEQFVADTWMRYRDVDEIVVGVQQANRRSWRALEKSGFVRRWAGVIESGDPSDEGPSYVYTLVRAEA